MPNWAGPAGNRSNSGRRRSSCRGAALRDAAVRRHLLSVLQLVQDVGESLGVHQAVLDGHVQQLLRNLGPGARR